MTEQLEQKPTKVSYLVRFIISVIYIVAAVYISIGIGMALTSEGCPGNRCTKVDQVIFAVIGLADFVIGCLMMVFGMMGKLPGTKVTNLSQMGK